MTGVSPLAKGPPPLMRNENSCLGKKSSGSSRTKCAEKTATKSLHEDISAAKQAKLMPSASFDNKLQQIIDSTPNCSSKISKGSKTKTSKLSSGAAESSSQLLSNYNSMDSSSRIEKTKDSLKSMQPLSTEVVKTESGSSNVETENAMNKEKTLTKLHTISKITENTAVITTISTPASTTATTTTAIISQPRPIQPRPMELKTNYEALVKSYGLNGVGNKLSSFPVDGKHVRFGPPVHMQSPLFMDPKIAAQPIKQILSGRGMPIAPETTSYLRNPALANFMHHLHMQSPSIPGLSGSSTPPLLSHSNGSTSFSNQPTSLHNPSVANVTSEGSQQQSKHHEVVPITAAASATGLLNNNNGNSSRASSPTAKLQQKIVSPISIPTAHITPFMSHN